MTQEEQDRFTDLLIFWRRSLASGNRTGAAPRGAPVGGTHPAPWSPADLGSLPADRGPLPSRMGLEVQRPELVDDGRVITGRPVTIAAAFAESSPPCCRPAEPFD